MATWTCSYDGLQYQLDPGNVGHFLLCQGRGLAEGYHTVQATFIEGANTIWVDSIHYVVSSTASIGDEWEMLFPLDTRIQYPSGSWYETKGNKWTNSYRGSMTYEFIGA